MEIKKGDLYFIRYYNNDRKRGRPAVVASASRFSICWRLASSWVRISSKRTLSPLICTFALSMTSSGRPSIAILECVVSVGKNRLGDYMGHITLEEGAAIDSALCVAFDL